MSRADIAASEMLMIVDGARQRSRHRHDLRPDRTLRERRIEGGDTAQGRAQAMHAAGIGGIADRAGDVGAVGDVADAGRDRRAGAAGRSRPASARHRAGSWCRHGPRLVVNQR